MTKAELELLRESLPPFAEAREVFGDAVGEAASPVPVGADGASSSDVTEANERLLRYLQFYNIDYRKTFPDLTYRIGTVDSGDYRLAVHHWSRPGQRRLMLILHGYFDHAALYGHLVRLCLELGYDVVAFDLPGHGLSTGEQAAIEDFAHYRKAAEDVLKQVPLTGDRRDVMGQSTGGATTMALLLRQPELIDGSAVLLAPLVRPTSWGWIRVAHSLLGKLVNYVPRRFVKVSGDEDFLRFLREDPLQSRGVSVQWVGALRRWVPDFLASAPSSRPVLVVQGDMDGTVDWRYNLPQIQRLFPQSQTYMVKGARHHLVNETEALRAEFMGVVGEYLENGAAGPD